MVNLPTLLMALLMFPAPTVGKQSANRNAPSAIRVRQPGIKDLFADGPVPAFKDKLMLFGQFVGDWKIQTQLFDHKGNITAKGNGYVHIGWILYGSAIQDVWEGASDPPKHFGTTVRLYDPKIDAWQCTWITPSEEIVQSLVARKVGADIVMTSKTINGGYPERWIYSEITPNSWRWHSEESHDGGKTWILTQDTHAQRLD